MPRKIQFLFFNHERAQFLNLKIKQLFFLCNISTYSWGNLTHGHIEL